MSMFLSKALRKAEVFLERVDDQVAQASRRLAVEGATGFVEDDEEFDENEDAVRPARRKAAEIAVAANRSGATAGDATPVGDAGAVAVSRESPKGPLLPGPQFPVQAPMQPMQMQTPSSGAGPSGSHAPLPTPGSSEAPPVKNAAAVQMTAPPGPSAANTPQQPKSSPVGKFAASAASAASSATATPEKGTAAARAASILVPMESQPQTATAKFLMGINKARETAGTLLGETMVDDNEYINELTAENTELRKELESIEVEYEDMRQERSKMVKNLKRMKEIVTEMDETLNEKSEEARRLESELAEANDKLEKLQKDKTASNVSDKEALEKLRAKLNADLQAVRKSEVALKAERSSLEAENKSLREALKSGQDMELAVSTGARKEAVQAHQKYETEMAAHRETKRLVKEREESLEAQTALAAKALAAAERKADECLSVANSARTAQLASDAKLNAAVSKREIAFARISDLERQLHRYEGDDGAGPPGKEELESMQVTIAELENALETKNVELKRLEGEVEAVKDAMAARRDLKSPRSPHIQAVHGSMHSVEVEQKLRHMADASLRKQAQLEVLRSENRALQHQLDTERKRTREAQAMAAVASSSRQSIRGGFRGILETGEEERANRAYGTRDGPLSRFRPPRGWPRQLVRVVTTVDKFSAQALGVLRREPLFRVVLLVYFVLVHIYVWSLLRYHTDAITRSAKDGLTKGGGATH